MGPPISPPRLRPKKRLSFQRLFIRISSPIMQNAKRAAGHGFASRQKALPVAGEETVT
jgi:hypothetical protein